MQSRMPGSIHSLQLQQKHPEHSRAVVHLLLRNQLHVKALPVLRDQAAQQAAAAADAAGAVGPASVGSGGGSGITPDGSSPTSQVANGSLSVLSERLLEPHRATGSQQPIADGCGAAVSQPRQAALPSGQLAPQMQAAGAMPPASAADQTTQVRARLTESISKISCQWAPHHSSSLAASCQLVPSTVPRHHDMLSAAGANHQADTSSARPVEGAQRDRVHAVDRAVAIPAAGCQRPARRSRCSLKRSHRPITSLRMADHAVCHTPRCAV